MCHETTGASYDRPLFPTDLPLIMQHYSQLDPAGVEAVYQAITDHHWPQPAVMIAVLELVDRAQRGDCGYYPHPTMPFSAMDLETLERVQSEGMYAFHTVFESMALAQRNMELLNQALSQHFGLKLVLFCDCGCGIVPAHDEPFEADWYQVINQLRSLAEAVGTRVVRVDTFQSQTWRERDLDMGASEESSYDKMYRILAALPKRRFDIKQLASERFTALFTTAA
jgi:hypothetical protein